jgi:hypothetical protein
MSSYYRKRALLLIATAAACAVVLAVARWARVPYFEKYESSVWVMPGAVGRLAMVVAAFVAATAIATILAGGVRIDAGLFAAAVGLAALSTRGGPMRYVLAHAETQPSVYAGLFFELLTLAVTMAALWATLVTLSRPSATPGETPPSSSPEASEPGQGALLLAALLHIILTGGVALLLLASDDKKQAITGLFVASFTGVMVASWITPARAGAWLWAAPLIVGLIGYAAAWLGHPILGTLWSAGPLLRAAPLDYAGAGVAGAIFGRWVGVTQEQARLVLKVALRA